MLGLSLTWRLLLCGNLPNSDIICPWPRTDKLLSILWVGIKPKSTDCIIWRICDHVFITTIIIWWWTKQTHSKKIKIGKVKFSKNLRKLNSLGWDTLNRFRGVRGLSGIISRIILEHPTAHPICFSVIELLVRPIFHTNTKKIGYLNFSNFSNLSV